MNGSTKTKSDPSTEATLAELEAETQDEIEQIMSEIEELQQELGDSTPVMNEPRVDVGSTTGKISSRQTGPTGPVLSSEPLPPTEPEIGPEMSRENSGVEDRSLNEFVTVEPEAVEPSPAESEPWVEETLAHLAGGPISDETPITEASEAVETSILDQADQAASEQLYEALQHGIQNLAKAPDREVVQSPSVESAESADSGDGSVTLSMKGATNFKLSYEIGGREVVIALGADGIKLQLSDGTELTIPVRPKLGSTKKVA